ncbi:MAG: nickel pincer cofactor biosynthesis protein LarB [Phycisphaerae bacterium]|nr:nickel pincer cofactor biosynthesis protein LarB [Phycisphaerae bacterium]
MNVNALLKLLKDVQSSETSPEEAMERLRHFPYEDLGFAKLDHHRHLRCGFPEVIFCEGKTTEQVVRIVQRLVAQDANVLATRASADVGAAVKNEWPKAEYCASARCITLAGPEPAEPLPGIVVIVSAGTSDQPVAEEARITCEMMGCNAKTFYDVGVAGLHRLLAYGEALAEATCIIAVAGMEGALPSVIGGLVECPVIAVPTSIGYGASFQGLAPLLTMLNSCAAGVSVVNIDNGFGAGHQAGLILRAVARIQKNAGHDSPQ